MIAPMQYILGTFTRCGTSPSAVARIRIMHAERTREDEAENDNKRNNRTVQQPPINPVEPAAQIGRATTVITYAAHAARTPITVSSLIEGNGSSDSATITPLRIRDRAKSAASPMKAFEVFAAFVARIYARRSFSYPITEASTPFADAVESPGSHPTATPAAVPSTEHFTTVLSSIRIPRNC